MWGPSPPLPWDAAVPDCHRPHTDPSHARRPSLTPAASHSSQSPYLSSGFPTSRPPSPSLAPCPDLPIDYSLRSTPRSRVSEIIDQEMKDPGTEICPEVDFALYNLRASNHLSELIFSYWDEESNTPSSSFTDLTFITKDLEKFNVHSIVFRSVSNLVQNILGDIGVPDDCFEKFHVSLPILDVRGEVLQYIIAFIYKGELNVPRSLLAEVIECAEVLEINILVDLITRIYHLRVRPSPGQSPDSSLSNHPSYFPTETQLKNESVSAASHDGRDPSEEHSAYVMRLLSSLAYHNAYKSYLPNVPDVERQSRSQSFDLGTRGPAFHENVFNSHARFSENIKMELASDKPSFEEAYRHSDAQSLVQSTMDDSSNSGIFSQDVSEMQSGIRVKKNLMQSIDENNLQEQKISSMSSLDSSFLRGEKMRSSPSMVYENRIPHSELAHSAADTKPVTRVDPKPFLQEFGNSSVRKLSYGFQKVASKPSFKASRMESTVKSPRSEPSRQKPLKAKRYKQYPPGAVDRAIRMIMEGVPVHRAADECGVPPRTLYEKKSIANGAKRQKKVKSKSLKQVGANTSPRTNSFNSPIDSSCSLELGAVSEISDDYRRVKSESPHSGASSTRSFSGTPPLPQTVPSLTGQCSSRSTDDEIQINDWATEKKEDLPEESHIQRHIGLPMQRLFLSKSVSPTDQACPKAENVAGVRSNSLSEDAMEQERPLDLRDDGSLHG